MNLARNPLYNTSNSALWQNDILVIRKGGGKTFTSKALITGFKLDVPKIELGPITIRQYNRVSDKKLGVWNDNCSVAELKYQDVTINPPQDSPVSMYVEPFWFMHSFYYALQLLIDGWVGMFPAYQYDEIGKEVGVAGGYITQVADSFHSKPDPSIRDIDKKELLKLISAQYGKCGTAIDRYSKACCEILDEGVVDFATCLDSLLGYKSGGAELSHRIAARGAILLTSSKKDLDKRKGYYHAIRYMYALRSNIVHGDKNEISLPSSKAQMKALALLGVDTSGDYFDYRGHIAEFVRATTRQILLYFINNEKNLEKAWLEDLDLGLTN